MRAAGIRGIDFRSFQDEFDLGGGDNSFYSVAAAVEKKYPQVHIAIQHFRSGADKLRFLEERLAKKQPTLINLAMAAQGGSHIMPVVAATKDDLIVLMMVETDGTKDVRRLSKAEFVR